MIKQVAWVLALSVALTSCETLHFYAPEIDSGWTSTALNTVNDKMSANGVTVQRLTEEYSKVKSVGNILMPAYEGSRSRSWSVEGPSGYKATIEVIQKGLVFSGPMEKNILTPNGTDYGKLKTTIRIKDGQSVIETTIDGFQSFPDLTVAGVTLKPTYQGTTASKGVQDYSKYGMVMGVRVTQGDQLIGYLSRTGQRTVLTPANAAPAPLAWGVAIVLNEDQFRSGTIQLVYDAPPGVVESHS